MSIAKKDNMKKIIVIGLLLLFALFISSVKKPQIPSKKNNYFKTHIKIDTPDLITSQRNNINNFYQKPKIDFIQNLTNTNKQNVTTRHQKGKIAYIQKTATP